MSQSYQYHFLVDTPPSHSYPFSTMEFKGSFSETMAMNLAEALVTRTPGYC